MKCGSWFVCCGFGRGICCSWCVFNCWKVIFCLKMKSGRCVLLLLLYCWIMCLIILIVMFIRNISCIWYWIRCWLVSCLWSVVNGWSVIVIFMVVGCVKIVWLWLLLIVIIVVVLIFCCLKFLLIFFFVLGVVFWVGGLGCWCCWLFCWYWWFMVGCNCCWRVVMVCWFFCLAGKKFIVWVWLKIVWCICSFVLIILFVVGSLIFCLKWCSNGLFFV